MNDLQAPARQLSGQCTKTTTGAHDEAPNPSLALALVLGLGACTTMTDTQRNAGLGAVGGAVGGAPRQQGHRQ